MHRIGVVGLSYRHATVEEVARLAVPRAAVAARLPELLEKLAAAEILYIGTCNRVEVVYAMPDAAAAADCRHAVFRLLSGREPEPGEATRSLRAWTGEAAVEHLFLLACGLDSAQTGEHEIAAQLRGAWEDSRAARTCGPVLDRVLGEALGMAREVRRLSADARAPSLGDLAAQRILAHCAGRQRQSANGRGARVALVGVSAMTRRCAALLHEARLPLLIVNRTAEAAEALAATVSGVASPLEAFRAHPPAVSAVVLATGGAGPALDGESLVRLARAAGAARPLLIDFGVPANVEPAAAERAGLERIGMSELIAAAQGERLAQLMRLAPVRAAIDLRLARLRTELATRALGPRLAGLRDTYQQIAAAEVARALGHELRTLDAVQRRELERLARSLALRLVHLPLAGLKAAALHASHEAVDAFFAATGSPLRGARTPRGNGET